MPNIAIQRTASAFGLVYFRVFHADFSFAPPLIAAFAYARKVPVPLQSSQVALRTSHSPFLLVIVMAFTLPVPQHLWHTSDATLIRIPARSTPSTFAGLDRLRLSLIRSLWPQSWYLSGFAMWIGDLRFRLRIFDPVIAHFGHCGGFLFRSFSRPSLDGGSPLHFGRGHAGISSCST